MTKPIPIAADIAPITPQDDPQTIERQKRREEDARRKALVDAPIIGAWRVWCSAVGVGVIDAYRQMPFKVIARRGNACDVFYVSSVTSSTKHEKGFLWCFRFSEVERSRPATTLEVLQAKYAGNGRVTFDIGAEWCRVFVDNAEAVVFGVDNANPAYVDQSITAIDAALSKPAPALARTEGAQGEAAVARAADGIAALERDVIAEKFVNSGHVPPSGGDIGGPNGCTCNDASPVSCSACVMTASLETIRVLRAEHDALVSDRASLFVQLAEVTAERNRLIAERDAAVESIRDHGRTVERQSQALNAIDRACEPHGFIDHDGFALADWIARELARVAFHKAAYDAATAQATEALELARQTIADRDRWKQSSDHANARLDGLYALLTKPGRDFVAELDAVKARLVKRWGEVDPALVVSVKGAGEQ